jgi:hypothetical protein
MDFYTLEVTGMIMIIGRNLETKVGRIEMFFLYLKNLSAKKMVKMNITELMEN